MRLVGNMRFPVVELHYVISRRALLLQDLQGNPDPSHGTKPAGMGFCC